MEPRTAWILTNPHNGHIVYPYTDDQRLIEAVGFYASVGLALENAVVLIVTEVHRLAIRKYLKADGNVQALEASGQLCFLDAGEVMSAFMVDGIPDPKLFKAVIKAFMGEVRRNERTGRTRKVRLFGEMVSLLWPANPAAAERLEDLWNEVIAEYSTPLLCAYAMDGPGRGPLPESLIKAHSHTIA
jgi:hypothetical protein